MINHFRTLLMNTSGNEGVSFLGQYIDPRFRKIREDPAEESIRGAVFSGFTFPNGHLLQGLHSERNFIATAMFRLMTDCLVSREAMKEFDGRLTFDPRESAISHEALPDRPRLIEDLWGKINAGGAIARLTCTSEKNSKILQDLVSSIGYTSRLDQKLGMAVCALCVSSDEKLDDVLR